MQFHIIQFTKTFLSVIFFALFMTLILHPFHCSALTAPFLRWALAASMGHLYFCTFASLPVHPHLRPKLPHQQRWVSSAERSGLFLLSNIDVFMAEVFSSPPKIKDMPLFLNVHESTTKKESKLEANIEKEKQSQVF